MNNLFFKLENLLFLCFFFFLVFLVFVFFFFGHLFLRVLTHSIFCNRNFLHLVYIMGSQGKLCCRLLSDSILGYSIFVLLV